jgi:hypothetical protein
LIWGRNGGGKCDATGKSIILGPVAFQTHFIRDVFKLLFADFRQLLSTLLELLVNLDGLLGHLLVGFLGAAHQREIFARRQPFVAIGIQSDSQYEGLEFLFAGRLSHQTIVKLK